MSAVISVILYAAPIWQTAIQYKHYENMLEKLNRRMAIRITSAYRTAPTTALLVIAGTPPIKEKIKERITVYAHGIESRQEAENEMLDS